MASYSQPLIGSSTLLSVTSSQWMGVGQVVYHSNGGYYKVGDKPTDTSVTLINLGYPGNPDPGSTVVHTGATISPAGKIGPAADGCVDKHQLVQADLDNGYIELTQTPANNDAVLVTVLDGPVLTNGNDFVVTTASTTRISWQDTGLASVLSLGDVIVARYSKKYMY